MFHLDRDFIEDVLEWVLVKLAKLFGQKDIFTRADYEELQAERMEEARINELNKKNRESQINDRGEHSCPVVGDIYVVLAQKDGKFHDFTPEFGFNSIYFARLYIANEAGSMSFYGGSVQFWCDQKLIESYTHEEMWRKREVVQSTFRGSVYLNKDENVEWIKSNWDKF